jgi:hypothetical protein
VSTVAHVCRKKLKKNPPNISVIFLYFLTVLARGGGGARVEWGRVRAPSQRFLRAFWRSTGDPARGRGTLHTNPLPPGCDHHRTSITRASIIYSIKSPTQRFLRAFRAKDRRSDEGEGGKAHNPLPPGCDHQRSPITRAPARKKCIFL